MISRCIRKQQVEAAPMVEHKTPFGDEHSNLLDRFERMWFEAHLNRAMQARSFSFSSQPDDPSSAHRHRKQRRRSGPRFHRFLKKLIGPILSFNSKITNDDPSKRQVQGPKRHPLTMKAFSRSLHF